MTFIPQRWRRDRFLWLICALTFGLALAYNFAIMPGFGPDEPRHLAYVRLLWEEHALPRVISMQPYSEYRGAHAFHPPLYYALLLPFYAVGQTMSEANLTHWLRFWSGLTCVMMLPLLYDVALVAARDNRWAARLALGMLALLPMFGMTAGTINNDAGAFWFVSLFLWLLLFKWAGEFGWKRAALLGLVLGAGGLCKATALAVGLVAIVIWAAVWARDQKNAARYAGLAAVAAVVGAFIVAPWHARSMALYGTWNPLPPAAPWGQLPPQSLGKIMALVHPDFPGIFLQSNFGIFATLWSQRDWLGQKVVPPTGFPPPWQPLQLAIVLTFAALATLACVGHLRARKTKIAEDAEFDARSQAAYFAPLAAFGAVWLTVLQVALFLHQGWAEGGRYLFPILIGFTVFLAVGLGQLFARPGALRAVALACLLFVFSLDALSLFWLVSYLNPTFGPK